MKIKIPSSHKITKNMNMQFCILETSSQYITQDLSRKMIHAQAPTKALA